ncbi:MAG: hypothetical protein ACRET4_02095, partial [Steroidobacteraceae bacterium]
MTSGRHLLSIFVYFVLVVAAAFGGTVVVAVLTPRATPAAQAWFLKGALVMLLVVAITHYHLRRADQRWSSFGVIQDRIPGSTFSGGLLGILLAGLWCFVVWYLAPFDVSRNAQLIPLQFVTASLGTVAMGIAEEVGYRTYGMRELQRAGGDLLAVLLPSA